MTRIVEEEEILPKNENEFNDLNNVYDECLMYLKSVNAPESDIEQDAKSETASAGNTDEYDEIKTNNSAKTTENSGILFEGSKSDFKVESETKHEVIEVKSERLRRFSRQLPKIVITQSNNSLNIDHVDSQHVNSKCTSGKSVPMNKNHIKYLESINRKPPAARTRHVYGDYPKRLVSKSGLENVALISNVPFEKIRLLNDAFHTLINLRWRWIVMGTIVLHFAIWLVFAIFWYITALAHYDFEPDPPKKACVTGGKDFVTIFLASVEAQTTIGFGDRTIDEECPESIFLFIMQLILGTGLSGVLTCVVYAKLTRPEKLSRDGVGFSKKAVISLRDGQLCLMLRAWDLNYDHIISSDFSAHFVKTHRTKEGEVIRYYARSLELRRRQFLLWPVTLQHVIEPGSPLYDVTPHDLASLSYEITVSLKGASASMGTFTQSQTSYLPCEVVWGYRFPSVVRYDNRHQKYVIDRKKLNSIEPVETPMMSARQFYSSSPPPSPRPAAPPSPAFSERISSFHLERSSSFRRSKESKV